MVKAMMRQDTCEEMKYEPSDVSTSINHSPNSPLDLSIWSKHFPFKPMPTSPSELSQNPVLSTDRQMSVDTDTGGPLIITQPKSEWHYRSVKDLASNHLPFVAGDGPQRTPIRVAVPDESAQSMYLKISLVTVKDEPHPSKVIVPAKTTVILEQFSHDNNLDCLKIDENSTDHFDSFHRCIYSRISSAEHKIHYKDVRIRMFNLYQNQYITKDMIETQQLNQCKLRFCLCIHQNGIYIPVSEPSFSIIIEEKKMTSRPRVPQTIGKPTAIPNPFSMFYIDSIKDENTNDDYDDSC